MRTITIVAILCLLVAPHSVLGQADPAPWPQPDDPAGCANPPPVVSYDAWGDGAPRRTDLGADGPLDVPLHAVPDIVGHRVGRWQPAQPDIDLYHGCWHPQGLFFRFDIAFAGLVNPPGMLALSDIVYEPFFFGPHPVFGFVEFDMDANINTGGDTQTPQSSFLGNVARFGTLPMDPASADRMAARGDEIDASLLTPPFVERSGEDFHLALFGDLAESIVHAQGNGDMFFEAGDVWLVRGRFFHRAHGYEMFSSSNGDGSYAPRVDLRFEYIAASDVTQITLVYALTNLGAAQQLSVPFEPPDGTDANLSSVHEAMHDLTASVQAIPPAHPLRSDPAFALIAEWESQTPAAALAVDTWRLNAIVSMAYAQEDPFGATFVWTDAIGDGPPGDFDDDGLVTLDDVAAFDAFLATNDGRYPIDDDGLVDGRVTIAFFGPNFDVHDLNYDGTVDAFDKASMVIRGDLDGDLDMDENDLLLFTVVLADPTALQGAGCEPFVPVGACCVAMAGAMDICVELDALACQSEGGVYFGDGVGCEVVATECGHSPPAFACCLPNTTCTVLPEGDCWGLGGVPMWPSESCVGISCTSGPPVGACCVHNPMGGVDECLVADFMQCQAMGGTYFGDGVPCNSPNVPCAAPQPRACCLPDATCIEMPPEICFAVGGIPLPQWVPCSQGQCDSVFTTGACCLQQPVGQPISCVVAFEGECLAQGGVYHGANTTCNDPAVPCHALPPLEIFMAVLLGENADPLAVGLSDVNGDGRTDGEDIQPYMQRFIEGGPSAISGGACCFGLGGASPGQCVVLMEWHCAAEGGIFQGDGSSCDDANLPCVGPPEFGACCLPSGACEELPFEHCAAIGGYHGERGSTCEDVVHASLLPRADFDDNGLLDGRDIQGFVELLLTQ